LVSKLMLFLTVLLLSFSVFALMDNAFADLEVDTVMFHAINIKYGTGAGFKTSDLDKIKQLGFDTVRLWVYWNRLQPSKATSVDYSQFTTSVAPNCAGLDTYVKYCIKIGLKVIIVLAFTPSYPPPSWSGIYTALTYPVCEALFVSGTAKNGYVYAWKEIARRYANNANVMFELINEPGVTSKTGAYPTIYKQWCENIISAIESVERVVHLKIVPMLRWGSAWMEVVDEQPDVSKANVAWSTHRYEPSGDYYPSSRMWCYDYNSKTWGWFTQQKYVYWRIRRCADKIKSWGKPWCNTEIGHKYSSKNWDLWLKYVLDTKRALGVTGWGYWAWDRSGGSMSLIDSNGNVRQNINAVLTPYLGSA